MDWSLLIHYLPALLHGIAITIVLVACSLIVGLLFACLVMLARQSKQLWLQMPARGYIFFIRGTPLLVQIYLLYYGTAQFSWITTSPLWPIFKHPFSCAVLALALNTSAYTAELLHGAFAAIPHGEIEACQAIGMSPFVLWRRIILPRAFRIALPAYGNEVIMVVKCSTLVSTITLLDLLGVIRQIISETYAAIQFLLIAGIIYLLLNAIILSLFKQLERRWLAYL
ncbi:MAG: ABC transporter permease [Gammaproteobacteria bacterium]